MKKSVTGVWGSRQGDQEKQEECSRVRAAGKGSEAERARGHPGNSGETWESGVDSSCSETQRMRAPRGGMGLQGTLFKG